MSETKLPPVTRSAGRPDGDGGRKRLNLSVSQSVNERLERLKTLSESESVTEVIRRSLAVYEELLETQKEGGKVIIRDKNGEDVILKIVW